MGEHYDGGQAFPDGITNRNHGLSLRDYFAAAALRALILERDDQIDAAWDHEQIARGAYSIADAMLAARKDKP